MGRKPILKKIAEIDVVGLVGLVVLFTMTYGIFWYYSEILKGNQTAVDLRPKAASSFAAPHSFLK